RGPHDPGQGRAVSDLVERRVGANRLDQAVVGDDEGRDAHATALVLGNPPEIRVDSLEAHIIDSLASARRAPAPRPPSSAPEALSWWPATRRGRSDGSTRTGRSRAGGARARCRASTADRSAARRPLR